MSYAIGSSIVIQHEVTNPLQSPIYVNDADVTVTIFDCDGEELAGESWPVTLPYVAASDGIYRVTLDVLTGLTEGQMYEQVIEVVGSDALEDKCTSHHRAINQKC